MSYLFAGVAFLSVLFVEQAAVYIASFSTGADGLALALHGHDHMEISQGNSDSTDSLSTIGLDSELLSVHGHNEAPQNSIEISQGLIRVLSAQNLTPVKKHTKFASALLLLLALSFHGVLEGMGFGDGMDPSLAIAICSHKGIQ